MRIRVTDEGVLVPRHLLPNAEEVDVAAVNGVVVITPAPAAAALATVETPEDDPIYRWGTNPVRSGILDGSTNHDWYIYDAAHPDSLKGTKVTLPPLGASSSEAVLLKWTCLSGARVSEGDVIAEVETDKANHEVSAPASGILRTLKQPGDTIKVNEVFALIG